MDIDATGGSIVRISERVRRAVRRRIIDVREIVARRQRIRRGTLRWAIKISSPDDASARRWGDTAFAEDLADSLRRRGQTVAIDHLGARHRAADRADDVVLVLRGLHRIDPVPHAINYLWIISHPDEVGDDEARLGWDRVFAASRTWDRAASIGAKPLLQASSTQRFALDRSSEDIVEDVLFVGTSRGVVRPVVRDAIDVGADLAIYGHDWDDFVDARFVRSDHLDFAAVPRAYRGARIVLNDHWADMRRHGFISNRLFDAASVGALIVSDDIDGIDDIFCGLVQTYDDAETLRLLLEDDSRWPGAEERMRIAERIRAEHSFDARAATLVASALEDARRR